ncbi:hypothetical protein NKJ06_17090 [Mesorhizobium sp. M0293]|uniref:hypothetical protein n=1 Tax=unclassified Mesorhizobium TaxID=325217 RepID=UPI0033382D8E
MDHTDLVELLDYTHAQLSKIRQAVAASEHAGAMVAIDCLVGAAAEQTKCKLASLEHAGLPISRHGAADAFGGSAARSGKVGPSGKPAAGGNRS